MKGRSAGRPANVPRRGTALSRRETLLGALALSASGHASAAPARPMPSRGFNLPGWVDKAQGLAPGRDVLEKLRQTGFETVRLPVDGDLIIADSKAFPRRLHEAIAELTKLGFAVMVDMHPSANLHGAFQKDATAAAVRVEQAWAILRAVIADLPTATVYPELLNEPPMERTAWLGLRDRLAESVRAKCPLHTLIWGPARFQGTWEIEHTPPLADQNQIAAIHYYAPLAFTHQCQTWEMSPLARISNLPFPATKTLPQIQQLIAARRAAGDVEAADLIEKELAVPWTTDRISSDFKALQRWSAKTACPVIVNEFGVLNFCVDAKSRTTWVRSVRQAAEANRIGWTYWELDQGFGFIRSRQSTAVFDTSMITALLGK
ncbi:cellulase family glycosylhydrolase [Methylocella sp. CPCC 101449]|uniref:glycoside hydrolase family 5 protein n=1 Tax=Methylocella sp. CPCC 101449 TaxID=2987531 RepID=UPI00288E5C1B|nr:cellulase family glycosylhydrolase [Methylocella sp. CPCC 101449]MDT2022944.1 glycoside hydrolase family 5 protein [Methylocella sp. CPCC 101449]